MNIFKAFWRWWGKNTASTTWAEVRKEILDMLDESKVKFDVTPYYYKVTSGRKTWYWKRDTGEFDGTSWDYENE
jgi:hypothetical protein